MSGTAPLTRDSTSKPQIHCLQITQPKITLVDEHVASIIGVHKAEMKRRGITNLYCWSSTDHLPRKARLPVGTAWGEG